MRQIILGMVVLFLTGSVAHGSLPIRRESPKTLSERLSNALDTEADIKDASAEEIKSLYHKSISDLVSIDGIKEIIVPSTAEKISDAQIQAVLTDAKIVDYKDLVPWHLLPCQSIVVKTKEEQVFELCLFPQDTPDSRGMITLPDHKRYWFAILKENP